MDRIPIIIPNYEIGGLSLEDNNFLSLLERERFYRITPNFLDFQPTVKESDRQNFVWKNVIYINWGRILCFYLYIF